MSTPNPTLDALNAIKVPSNWPISQALVDLVKQHAAQGTQIGMEDLDKLFGCIVGSQIEVIHAAGSREAQATQFKESLRNLGDLFKNPKKGE